MVNTLLRFFLFAFFSSRSCSYDKWDHRLTEKIPSAEEEEDLTESIQDADLLLQLLVLIFQSLDRAYKNE